MNIEEFREICMSMQGAEESLPFGDSTLAFRAPAPNKELKIFALVAFEKPTYGLLKCDPETAIALRSHYDSEIEEGWHMNKVHWNGIYFDRLPEKLVSALICHSHALIVLSGARNAALRAKVLDNLIKAAKI